MEAAAGREALADGRVGTRSSIASRAAILCVPLILAPPLIQLGQFGITIPEMMIFAAGAAIVLGQTTPRVRIPPLMIMWIAMFTLGWLGSLQNAPNWDIPTGPWNISFFYAPVLGLMAFLVGRYSRLEMREIITHPVAKAIMLGVGAFAVIYPFLSFGTRQLLFAPFLHDTNVLRLMSPRFPGIGINANTYAFMVFVMLLFAFEAYLEGRLSAMVSLALGLTIVAASSRTVIGLSLAACFAMVAANSLRRRSVAPAEAPGAPVRARRGSRRTRMRALVLGVAVAGLVYAAVKYGDRISDVFAAYSRVSELFGDGPAEPLEGRKELWATGYARVKLAPILGIPRHVSREDDYDPLYSYTPHNEFLFYWMIYGITGLLAFVFLIVAMMAANVAARSSLTWLLLYLGLIVQMNFDAVFQGTRVLAFMFMIIGLNMKTLAARARPRTPAAA